MTRKDVKIIKDRLTLIDGKVCYKNGCYEGKEVPVSMIPSGYLSMGVSGNRIGAHVAIYCLHNNDFDLDGYEIDHKDRDKTNNDPNNLRKATKNQQMGNRGMVKSNKTGYKGVYARRDKFIAQVKRNGKDFYLGIFKTAKEAATAYDTAALSYFGEYAATNASLGLLN